MKQSRRKSLRHRTASDNDEFGEKMTQKPKGHSRVGKGGIPQLNPLVEMLKQATVEQAVPFRKVAVLDDTNTVSEALKVHTQSPSTSSQIFSLCRHLIRLT